jgi:hypothetical protein
MENGGWQARRVLECGGLLPLLRRTQPPRDQSARGLAQSKTWRSFVAAVVYLASAIIAHAQNYSIEWSRIGGAGATSAGGVYDVNETIGQADAGAASGGSYTLEGRFGSGFTLDQPVGPLLRITLNSHLSTINISWPSPATGFVLQHSTDLDAANWIGASETVSDNGTNKFVIVNPPAGTRFYRLFKP